MRKKIVVFHPALAPYRVDFFNALSETFDASFYFSHDNLIDQKFDQYTLREQCLFDFNLLDKGLEIGNRSIRMGIWHLLRKHKPKLVICSEYSQITFAALAYKLLRNRTLKVYTISDDSLDLSIRRKGIRSTARKFVSYIIDGIIFPSDVVGNWYHKNVNKKTNFCTLPIVHENKRFRENLYNALPLSQNKLELFSLQGKKVFLFAGRLVKFKNVDLLLRAYASSLKRNVDSVLIIIGEGNEYNNLVELANFLGIYDKCLFLGRLEGEELYAWYNLAQCFILPSYQEPYGVVVNEALLAGCDVICSTLAGASELIDYTNGSVFNPYDSSALADELILIYNKIQGLPEKVALRHDRMPFELKEKVKIILSFLNCK